MTECLQETAYEGNGFVVAHDFEGSWPKPGRSFGFGHLQKPEDENEGVCVCVAGMTKQ